MPFCKREEEMKDKLMDDKKMKKVYVCYTNLFMQMIFPNEFYIYVYNVSYFTVQRNVIISY